MTVQIQDSGGNLTATVGIGDDITPRTITLTVTSGGVTTRKSFAVVEGSDDRCGSHRAPFYPCCD